MKKNTRTYGWAVVNTKSGAVMRERNGTRREAIYRTRDAARTSAKTLGGRVVSRSGASTAKTAAANTAILNNLPMSF
jgi:hypothetical protein